MYEADVIQAVWFVSVAFIPCYTRECTDGKKGYDTKLAMRFNPMGKEKTVCFFQVSREKL